jgi:CRP/FNR family transcriptional regulator
VPGEIRAILEACSMFSSLDGQRLDMLAAMARRRTFPRGEMIFRQDEPCPGLFIVGQGRVRIYKLAPSGKEHVLHLAGPGMTFAEVAVIGDFPCPAFAEAMEPTNCALLPAEAFRRALRDDHELCLGLMTGMAGWVRTLVGLMEDIVLRDAIGRLARYLLDAAAGQGGEEIELPALKRHLASHLNLTSETLSRTLKRLADAQLIEQVDARRLRIIDAACLRDVADGLFPEL